MALRGLYAPTELICNGMGLAPHRKKVTTASGMSQIRVGRVRGTDDQGMGWEGDMCGAGTGLG